MKLEKVITVVDPAKRAYLFGNETFNLSIDFFEGYPFAKVNGESVNLTNQSYESPFNISFGANELVVSVSDENHEFVEVKDFAVVEGFDVNRKVSCEGCIKNKVRREKNVTVDLSVNFSHDVSDFLVKEYVPIEWEVVYSAGGEVVSSGSDYNIIIWNVTGALLNVSYSLISPSIGGDDSFFAVYLEDLYLEEEG
jgi:hypothetical protein